MLPSISLPGSDPNFPSDSCSDATDFELHSQTLDSLGVYAPDDSTSPARLLHSSPSPSHFPSRSNSPLIATDDRTMQPFSMMLEASRPRKRLRRPARPQPAKEEPELQPILAPVTSHPSSSLEPQNLQTPQRQPRSQPFVEDTLMRPAVEASDKEDAGDRHNASAASPGFVPPPSRDVASEGHTKQQFSMMLEAPHRRKRLRRSVRPHSAKAEHELPPLPAHSVSHPPSSAAPQHLQTPQKPPRSQPLVEDSPMRLGAEASDDGEEGGENRAPVVLTRSAPPRKRAEARVEIAAAAGPPTTHAGELYHVRSFVYVVCEALTHHAHLLRRTEVDIVHKFVGPDVLSAGAIDLFARVYRRKHEQWLPETGLVEAYAAKMTHGADVAAAVAELVEHGMFESSVTAGLASERKTALQMLETLKVDELRKLWKMVPSSAKHSKKVDLLRVLQRLLSEPAKSLQVKSRAGGTKDDKGPTQSPVKSQSRLQVFSQGASPFKMQSTLTNIPPSTRIAREILSNVGHSVRIPENVLTAVRRAHFVVLLNDDVDAIRTFAGQLRFPSYVCERKTHVYPSQEALVAFEEALELERTLDEAVDPKVRDWLTAAERGAVAELEVRKVMQGLSETQMAAPKGAGSVEGDEMGTQEQSMEEIHCQLRHPFLRRYTAHWVYVRAAWRSVAALEALGEYETAVIRLELLLETKLLPKRRGQILERLTINLNNHLKKRDEAMRHIVSALDENAAEMLRIGDRLELAKRAENIHRDMRLAQAEATLPKELKGKKRRLNKARELIVETLPRPVRKTLDLLRRDIPEQIFHCVPLSQKSETPRKRPRGDNSRLQTRLKTETKTGGADAGPSKMGVRVSYKSLADGGVVNVEGLSLQWYRARGEWLGCHDEGGAFRFIFALLLWECALFAAVPDVFHSPFQDHPLDLRTEAFYISRKDAIDKRIADIEKMNAGRLEEEVQVLHERYYDISCVGCRWKPLGKDDSSHILSKEELGCIAGGIGGKSLARICKLLATDYNYWSGGICDLVLWKREQGKPKAMLVEVKSAKDKLSARQRAWFSELMDMGVECEEFKVVDNVTQKNSASVIAAQLSCEELSRLKETQ